MLSVIWGMTTWTVYLHTGATQEITAIEMSVTTDGDLVFKSIKGRGSVNARWYVVARFNRPFWMSVVEKDADAPMA